MIRFLNISTCILVILAIILSSSATPTSAASIYYVSTSGYDGQDCLSPTTPCRTINGALARATDGDMIKVTSETYTGFGEEVVFVNKDVILYGGWNKAFTDRTGHTILDGQGVRQGMDIVESADVHIDYFIIQNGYNSAAAGGILNWGTLALENCLVQDNHGVEIAGGGISNYGSLIVLNSTIRDNTGPGIYNWDKAAPLTILNSTIDHNSQGVGVWILNQSASIVNSTISGNQNPGDSYDGGGIFYGGSGDDTLLLRNVTITGNQTANFGGGIFMFDQDGGRVLMSNSILAGNSAEHGPDCSGPIESEGYNIIEDTTGCTISSTVGDQLDVDPKIASLQYNGGPTFTHRLYAGSPAIDGGNPVGCQDQQGIPLVLDQRGFPRPLDGNGDGNSICDTGSYEYNPAQIILGSYLPMVQK